MHRRSAKDETRPRPRLLYYAMYDPTAQDSAPKVRIRLLAEALAERADLTVIWGSRGQRLGPSLRWLRRQGMGSVDAVYVESSTSTPMPYDLALFAWARLRGRPLGIYFRDAYQLFRDLYPVTARRQHLADLAWRLTLPISRHLATVRFVPSAGLARVMGLAEALVLPPGTDPSLPNLGLGPDGPLVAAIAAPTPSADIRLLLQAMVIVRERHPDARLRLIGRFADTSKWPGWVEIMTSDRTGLAELLRPASACVIPRRRTPYTDLAVPIKLTDLLAFGKPIVATATDASRAFVEDPDAVLFVLDTPEDLAAGIVRVLDEPALAQTLADRARTLAESPAMGWGARAERVLTALLPIDARQDEPEIR